VFHANDTRGGASGTEGRLLIAIFKSSIGAIRQALRNKKRKPNIQHHRQADNRERFLEYRNGFFTENRHKPASLPQAKFP
jgi:hypothetical protein